MEYFEQIIFFLIWNLFVFAFYGIDKYKAVRGKWRISEFTLILLAFLFGSIGAALGMKIFHHKIRKLKFRLLIPLAFLFNCVLLWVLFWR